MTLQQLNALLALFFAETATLTEFSWHQHNGNLFVGFVDNGGNRFKRSINTKGEFTELEA